MQFTDKIKFPIAHKWLSYAVLLFFIYYWVFTLAWLFFAQKMVFTVPRQSIFYKAFVRQGWKLFATTVVYNRDVKLVLKDSMLAQKTDTIPLVSYLLTEKRNKAPFNYYDEALDIVVFKMINELESQLNTQTKLLRQQYPGKTDSLYMRMASDLVEQDGLTQKTMQNLVSFAKYVLEKKRMNTAGKAFQLLVVHEFIPPQSPPQHAATIGNSEVVFVSTFKDF